VFESDGFAFKLTPGEHHHVHSCSFGLLCVKWQNVFSHRGWVIF
jgi:hypothetical protein